MEEGDIVFDMNNDGKLIKVKGCCKAKDFKNQFRKIEDIFETKK
jgi:hypothetical protein